MTEPSEKGYQSQNAEHTVTDKFCSPFFAHRYTVDQQAPLPPPPPTHTLGFSGIMCFIIYGHRAISCPVSFLYALYGTDRGTAIRIPHGYSTRIVQLSCSLHSLRMEIVRNSYVSSDAGGDCTVTVRSSSSLCVRVPKVYNFTFLPVLLVEMSPKICK